MLRRSSPLGRWDSLELPQCKPRPIESQSRALRPDLDGEDGCKSLGDDDTSIEPEPYLVLHARVYALAEKYDIAPLRRLAREKFRTAMTRYHDSPELTEAIKEVYCSTIDSSRGLRNVVLEAFKRYPWLADEGNISSMIKNTPGLATDLLNARPGILI